MRLKCIFLGYMWKIAEAIKKSERADLVYAGIEPQRTRSAEAVRFFEAQNIPTFDARKIRESGQLQSLLTQSVDLIVVGAFGQMLDLPILKAPKFGVINFHPSLLPNYRGGSPLEEMILNGEPQGGVTAHWMSEEVDSGQIIEQMAFPIGPHDDYNRLYESAHEIASQLMGSMLAKPKLDWLNTPSEKAPHFNTENPAYRPRTESDAVIDWNKSADSILRIIRALGWRNWVKVDPKITVRSAKIVDDAEVTPSLLKGSRPGQVLVAGKNPVIATGLGYICFTDWESAVPLKVGQHLGAKKQ